MSVYEILSGTPLLKKSYVNKFLFIVFLGIHVPLIGLIGYMLATTAPDGAQKTTVIIVLILTLLSTGATLPMLHSLLKPLVTAQQELASVMQASKPLSLPTGDHDEVGKLLSQIQDTYASLDQAIADRDSLFDIISHDFRAPLNRIVALCSLYDYSDEEERVTNVQTIRTEAEALHHEMKQLLNSLRTSASMGPDAVVDVAAIATDVVQSLDVIATDKQVMIHNSANGICTVKADPFFLKQAIKNLVTNAIKYSGSGKSIVVHTQAQNGKVVFSVADEGIGFYPADATRILDRFTDASRTGTQGESSNGVGLSIVRRIVERHGGLLQAHSDGPGKGAVFTFCMPAASGKA